MVDQDKVNELYSKLMAGVLTFKDSERFKQFLKWSSSFRKYSFSNQMLIWLQKPEATQVAGFRTWQTMGRYVKRGEKGIAILAPSIKKYEYRLFHDPRTGQDRVIGIDSFQAAIQNKTTLFGIPFDEWYAAYQNEPDITATTKTITRFLIVYVFDVSQTEGAALPTITDKLSGNVITPQLYEQMKTVAGVPVREGLEGIYAMNPGLGGYYDRVEKFIAIRAENPVDQKFKTLIHEMAHETLEHEPGLAKLSRDAQELIAESTAFIVSDYAGLDTTSYSFGYLASWSKEFSNFEQIGGYVNKTSNAILAKMRAAGILPQVVPQLS